MAPTDNLQKPIAAIIARKAPSEFDKLCDQLDQAERTKAMRPTEAEYDRRMRQGKQVYRAGGMSAQSLADLHKMMRRGHLPHHIGLALDRATGE
jgi:hypothetical protein